MMKVETFHEQLTKTEGKFYVRIGGDQPWAESTPFPYDEEGEVTFKIARAQAQQFYNGAKAMYEITKAQMTLSCSDAAIRNAKHS
jgi:hypothetical protein